MNIEAPENLHLFCEYPPHEHGVMAPVRTQDAATVEDALKYSKKTLSLDFKPHTNAEGRQGYIDQNGRFYVYALITSTDDMDKLLNDLGMGTEEQFHTKANQTLQ